MQPVAVVDLRPLKAEARRLLGADNPVRAIIEAEPDFLEGPQATQRLALGLRMVMAHRSAARAGLA